MRSVSLIALAIVSLSVSVDLAASTRKPPKPKNEAPEIEKDYASGLEDEASGQLEKAYQEYTVILQRDPNRAMAWRHRGEVVFALGRYKEASSDLTNAIGKGSTDAEAYRLRGDARRKLAQNQEAVEDYSTAITLKVEGGAVYAARADAYAALEQWPKALDDYTQAIRLKVESAGVYRGRGLTYVALGRDQEAVQDFDRSLEIAPSAESYVDRGEAFARLKDNKRAMQDFDQSLQAMPFVARALVLRGIAWEQRGEVQNAMLDYAEVVRLQPNYAFPKEAGTSVAAHLSDLSQRLDEQRRIAATPKPLPVATPPPLAPSPAPVAVQQTAQVNPQQKDITPEPGPTRASAADQGVRPTAESRELVVSLPYTRREVPKPAASPQPAVDTKRDPALAGIHQLHGRQLIVEGKFVEGVKEFDEAIRLNPDQPLAYNGRGYCHLRLHHYAEAVSDFTAAIRLNPKYGNAYQNRAMARKAQGDQAGAAADLKLAAQ